MALAICVARVIRFACRALWYAVSSRAVVCWARPQLRAGYVDGNCDGSPLGKAALDEFVEFCQWAQVATHDDGCQHRCARNHIAHLSRFALDGLPQ